MPRGLRAALVESPPRRWHVERPGGEAGATTWRSTSRATSARTGCWRCRGPSDVSDSRRPVAGHCSPTSSRSTAAGTSPTTALRWWSAHSICLPGRSRVPTPQAGAPLWRLPLPEAARAAASAAVAQLGGARLAPDGPLLAVHAPGGRAIKQWPVERFADAASVLATDIGASVVLTGASGDEAIVSEMESRLKRAWGADAARAGHDGPGRARGHAARNAARCSRATPGRCTWRRPSARRCWRFSGRRCRGATGRWLNPAASSASICPAVRAIASACRPNAVRDTRPTVSPRCASRPSSLPDGPSWRRVAPARRRGRGERARESKQRRVDERSTSTACSTPTRPSVPTSRPTSGSSDLRHARVDGAVTAGPVHASRRLALVVRRDLPAPDARRHRSAPGGRGTRAPRAAGSWRPVVRRWVRSRRRPRRTARWPRATGSRVSGPADARAGQRGTGTRAKALFHTATAMADRLRPIAARPRPSRVVAFVHSAFVGGQCRRGGLCRPGHPGTRCRACRTASRWWVWARGPTSASAGGAIACGSS